MNPHLARAAQAKNPGLSLLESAAVLQALDLIARNDIHFRDAFNEQEWRALQRAAAKLARADQLGRGRR